MSLLGNCFALNFEKHFALLNDGVGLVNVKLHCLNAGFKLLFQYY